MMTNDEKWSLMESTGNLFNFKEKRNIPKLLKDIGLGASLYLLTLKAFMWLFLGLTVLNFPILALYGSGKENVNLDTGIFSKYMLGNIGESGPNCQTFDLSRRPDNFTLSCPSGNLKRVVSVGLNSKKDQQCLPNEFNKIHTLWIDLDGQLQSKEDLFNYDNAYYTDTYMEFFP